FLSLTPAVANGGPRDAQRRGHHLGGGVEHIRRRGGARKRLTADHAAGLDPRREGAPMSELGGACDGHGGLASMGGSGDEPFSGGTQPSRDDMAMVSGGTSAAAFSTPKRIPVRFLQRFAFI